jgi:NAD(P)H-hydrate epimerase
MMNTPSIKQLQAWDAFKQMDEPVPSTVLLEEILQSLHINYTIITQEQIANTYKVRKPFSHKGNFGHALIMAGSKGKMGAALLCAKACLRTGAGLVTVAVPENTAAVIHTALPEAMVIERTNTFDAWNTYNAFALGPGWGIHQDHAHTLFEFIQNNQQPMVLDADAITILAEHSDWLNKLAANTILTPHPKEFDRLFGSCTNDFERWRKALDASVKYDCIIIVKGHFTFIAANGKSWINTTGNAGLAKGGSGDVLTGIIAGLLAQHYTVEQASIIGVYRHGLAADIALTHQTMESMLASDVIEALKKITR